ncbi:protoporphyrinogen oxidase [Novosphingobium sp. ST904]|nr:protoporphyrinogen oxidase [Novosphingobium sp. ST904]
MPRGRPAPGVSELPLHLAGGPTIVLGAGIAGLAAADSLVRSGHKVIVIERGNAAGGTHRSRQIGPYTFDVGSIFYEENARVFDLAPGIRDLCPQVLSLQRRVAPDGSILLYPIEPRDLLKQSPLRLARSVLDLLGSRIAVSRDGTLEAICRKRLGGTFFEDTGLRSYIGRFHHVPPDQIDEEFFFRRMAIIERFTRMNALARSAARAIRIRQGSQHRKRWPMRVRPREGYQAMFRPIVERLTAAGVEFAFGEQLSAVEREGSFFRVGTQCSGQSGHHGPKHGAGRDGAPRTTRLASAVVSTIPVDALHRVLFSAPSGTVSLDMTTLYVSAAHLHPDAGNVLFNFHAEGEWKRATIYSRIYPDPACGREFFSVETTLPPGARHSPGAAFEDFRDHATRLGLASDLRLEGHELVEDSYPLYTVGARARLDAALDRIAGVGIISAGRQGRFEYLPTSSGVIAQVIRNLDCGAAPAASPEMAA